MRMEFICTLMTGIQLLSKFIEQDQITVNSVKHVNIILIYFFLFYRIQITNDQIRYTRDFI